MTTSEIYSPGLEGVIAGETAISTVADGLRYRGYPVGELAEKATFDEVAYPAAARRAADREPAGRLPEARGGGATLAGRRCATCSRRCRRPPRRWTSLRTAVSILAHFDPDTADSSHEANLRKAERLLGQIPVAIADALPHQQGAGSRSRRGRTSGTRPTSCTCCAARSRARRRRPRPRRVADPVRRARVQRLDVHGPRRLLDGVGPALGHRRRHRRPQGPAARRRQREGDGHAGGSRRPGEGGEVGARGAGPQGADHGLRPSRLQGRRRAGRHPEDRTPARRRRRPASLQWEETAEIIERVLAAEKNLFPNLDWPAGRLYTRWGWRSRSTRRSSSCRASPAGARHVIEQLENNRLIRPRGRYTGQAARSVKPLGERG